ncbi:very-long-chain (3R)-3-hydroxyacyl-CoA dehydratase 2 isoform X1 [Brachionichthys hirsutus]|uniref:very-long-chain (3R)-3-hydroxyacyl-CoA dehydratase 2 isoform X1 n=1 Tax=Brachionichthys hirsutus TaxID=412623 RepID=UPI0036051AB0
MPAAAAGTSKAAHGDVAAKKKQKGPGALATAYLVIYNVVMTAGWLVIAVGLVRAYLARGSYHGLYYSIEKPLKFFQTGAILEVLHCAAGIVPSSVVLTGFQVMSRVFLTWAVTHSVREMAEPEPSAERRQRAAVRRGVDRHGDHPLLLLHLQSAQPPAVPHQVGQVHLLHRAVSHGRDRGAADHLRGVAVRAEDGPLLRHSAQQVQLLLRLLLLPHPRHDLLYSPLPPALLPHDPTEEEGPGPPGRLRQSGVSPGWRSDEGGGEKEKNPEQPTEEETRTTTAEREAKNPASFQTANPNRPGRRSAVQLLPFSSRRPPPEHKAVRRFCICSVKDDPNRRPGFRVLVSVLFLFVPFESELFLHS